MTPAQLIVARDGSGNAAAAALALWRSVVGWDGDGHPNDAVTARANVETEHAGAALDMIGQHVGTSTDVPDAVLREAVVRLAIFLHNTEGPRGRGLGLSEFKLGSAGLEWGFQTEFLGSALRRSGVMGLLIPWTAKRAGAI